MERTILMAWTHKEKHIFFQSLRFFRALHYGGLVFAGGLLALVNMHNQPLYVLMDQISGSTVFKLLLASVSLMFAFWALNLFNTFADVRTGMDKEEFSRALSLLTFQQWQIVAWICVAVSFLLSLILAMQVMILLGAYYFIGFIYFFPLLRLKRWYPVSTFLLGLAAVVAILIGFCTVADQKIESIPIPYRFLFIILVTMTISFATKDRKDFERDSAGDIKTLYTCFGPDKGRKINAILVFLSYSLIPILFESPIFFIITLPAGLSSALVTWSRDRYSEGLIFIIYFIFSLLFFGLLLTRYTELLV